MNKINQLTTFSAGRYNHIIRPLRWAMRMAKGVDLLVRLIRM